MIWREGDNELRDTPGSGIVGTNLSLRRSAEEFQETARVVFEFGDPSIIGLDKDDFDVACNTRAHRCIPACSLGGLNSLDVVGPDLLDVGIEVRHDEHM